MLRVNISRAVFIIIIIVIIIFLFDEWIQLNLNPSFIFNNQ